MTVIIAGIESIIWKNDYIVIQYNKLALLYRDITIIIIDNLIDY